MAKDAVSGFRDGVEAAGRDVIRKAGVDPDQPGAVKAWLDKDPLNREMLMKAGVRSMVETLAIGKVAGDVTQNIDGVKGVAAEMATNALVKKIISNKKVDE
jgi:hypothetical protein